MRRTLGLTLVLIAVLAVLAVACGDAQQAGPPDINYGRSVCTDCNMIINDPRFAAAYRVEGAEPAIFDDIGDLLRYGHRQGVLDEATAWVHDYEDESWIDAPDAWFVQADVQTPMGSGIVAFASEDDARAFAGEHRGEVLTWKDLVARAGDMERVPMMGHTDGEGG